MKEFVSILIGFICMSVADSIDLAFNNFISLDTIVVTGSFVLINQIFNSIGEIGIYTYRTTRKNEWKYLWFNIIFGLIVGSLIFIFKDTILNIFDLTINQKELLSSLLNIYIIYLVVGRFANAIFEIIRLKGQLKLYNKSLAVYYVSVLGLDLITYLLTKNLTLLFVATIVAWIISIIYMLWNLKLKFEYPDKKSLKDLFRYGFPYASERLFSRVFLLLYGVLASRMNTENYSIHVVCYSVCLTLEIITNAYQAALMIKVPKGKTYKEQYNICMNFKKKCFLLIIVLDFIFTFIYLFISHGSLPIEKCFPYILIYSMVGFGLYEYETYKTLCITQGKSYILFFGSMIGVIIRFLICLLFINSEYLLYVFGIVNFIDFYSRSIVYKVLLSKLNS